MTNINGTTSTLLSWLLVRCFHQHQYHLHLRNLGAMQYILVKSFLFNCISALECCNSEIQFSCFVHFNFKMKTVLDLSISSSISRNRKMLTAQQNDLHWAMYRIVCEFDQCQRKQNQRKNQLQVIRSWKTWIESQPMIINQLNRLTHWLRTRMPSR